jgi:hypothetical protein
MARAPTRRTWMVRRVLDKDQTGACDTRRMHHHFWHKNVRPLIFNKKIPLAR